jgi:hypothetical protein
MRPKLRHPLRQRPHERAERRAHEHRAGRRGAEPRVIVLEEPPASGASGRSDAEAEKVRRAGGPMDVAVYTCGCGYLFSAAVSTTVSCPHCGGDQAW